ncbi:MAG TPA: farnesyl diphosphate synthase [Longimicrobium sp.]|nr:farnesyl diphosphate synthase [Longimicrobium sp.]
MTSAVPAAFDVAHFLAAERDRVNAALRAVTPQAAEGASGAVREAILYALATPGKRVRPILCVAAWRALRGGEAPEGVYRLACAVELVHTYSLVHDDLPCMDDDDLRRGRPTVHRAFDCRRALLAGAALIPAAVRVLDSAAVSLGLDVETRRALVAELCRAAGAEGMVGGQLRDLEGEGRRLDAAGLERVHRGKTGALLAAALHVGAGAAGAGEEAMAALTVYGQDIGLAFQIVDDVLDVTGDAASLGKTAGKDQQSEKSTYPALFGLDGARRLAGERVAEAVDALRAGGIVSPELEALARYIVERRQ